MGVDVPLIGDFHFNGHKLLAQVPECARILDKYRINPGNVGHGSKRDDQFATMIEKAIEHAKPVRIGVNWGSLDPELLARMMDANAKLAAPREADAVMREALIVSALESAAKAEEIGLPGQPHHPLVQGLRRAGPDRRVPLARRALRLPAAPGPHRGGHGLEGHRRLDRRHGRAAAGGHRRHDPRFPHAGARRRSHARGDRCAGDPADDGASLLHAAGLRVPGVRAHHEHLLPGARGHDPGVPAPADAGVAHEVPGRGGAARCRHGLRGERPGRVEARRHRHLAARLGREAGGPGVRGRREDRDAQGRADRGGVPGDRRGLRARALRARRREGGKASAGSPSPSRRRKHERQDPGHPGHGGHPPGRLPPVGKARRRVPRRLPRLRLSKRPHAGRGTYCALRARHRGSDRHRREGDVHLRRPQRREPHAAPGGHRRHRARRHRAQPALRRPDAGVDLGCDVPLREAPEGPPARVPPVRRGGARLRGPGRGRRADRAARAPVEGARHRCRRVALELHRRRGRSPRAPREDHRVLRGPRRGSSTKTRSGGCTRTPFASSTRRTLPCSP